MTGISNQTVKDFTALNKNRVLVMSNLELTKDCYSNIYFKCVRLTSALPNDCSCNLRYNFKEFCSIYNVIVKKNKKKTTLTKIKLFSSIVRLSCKIESTEERFVWEWNVTYWNHNVTFDFHI